MNPSLRTGAGKPENRVIIPNLDRYLHEKGRRKLEDKDPITGRPLYQVLRVVHVLDPDSIEAKVGIGSDRNGPRGKQPGVYSRTFDFDVNPSECEPTNDIYARILRLHTDLAGFRGNPFVAGVLVHEALGPIAYGQGSVLGKTGVLYGQYGAIADGPMLEALYPGQFKPGTAPDLRGVGVSGLLFAAGFTLLEEISGRPSVGVVYESEFIGQATADKKTGALDPETMRYTLVRLRTHEKLGGCGVVAVMPDGKHIPVWKQPPLSSVMRHGREFAQGVPYMFNLALKSADPTPLTGAVREWDKGEARAVLNGLADNFAIEGFDRYLVTARKARVMGVRTDSPINGVELARESMMAVLDQAVSVLLVPLSQTQNYAEYAMNHPSLEAQVRRDYSPHTFAEMPLGLLRIAIDIMVGRQ